MAKLTAGLHKPNQQTVLPPDSVRALLDPLPIDRLRGFGGKLGEALRAGHTAAGRQRWCLERSSGDDELDDDELDDDELDYRRDVEGLLAGTGLSASALWSA